MNPSELLSALEVRDVLDRKAAYEKRRSQAEAHLRRKQEHVESAREILAYIRERTGRFTSRTVSNPFIPILQEIDSTTGVRYEVAAKVSIDFPDHVDVKTEDKKELTITWAVILDSLTDASDKPLGSNIFGEQVWGAQLAVESTDTTDLGQIAQGSTEAGVLAAAQTQLDDIQNSLGTIGHTIRTMGREDSGEH